MGDGQYTKSDGAGKKAALFPIADFEFPAPLRRNKKLVSSVTKQA